MTNLLTPQAIRESVELLIKKSYELVPVEIPQGFPSKWAERNRTLKRGKIQGAFSFDFTPYLREIVDNMSPQMPVREVAIMKGTRMGVTVGAIENDIGFTIAEDPCECVYITSNSDMAGAQMELRIDSLLDSSGLSYLIGQQQKRRNQKKTGDVINKKVFPGGFILAGGPRSPWVKRQFGYRKLWVDEVDAFPDNIDKEGGISGLLRSRASEYEDEYKILWASSPLLEHNSKILALFQEGDQRKYYVPCKKCGHMQVLIWDRKEDKGKRGGVKFQHTEDDRLVCKMNNDGEIISSSVYYECEDCGAHWHNSDKDWFLPRGEWRPTTLPRRPGMRSYHLPALYSPVGFRSWESGVIEFLNIKHEGFPRNEFQTWINTYLGEPFQDYGIQVNPIKIYTREKDYEAGTLPPEGRPLFVTIGADVHPDRIECEVVAWGRDKESWSINYHVIEGDTTKPDTATWEALRAVIKMTYQHPALLYESAVFAAVDAGDNTDTVYDFCDSFEQGVNPVMGADDLRRSGEYIKEREIKGRTQYRIDINTDLIKQEFYGMFEKSQYESGEYPRGFCHFPQENAEGYGRDHYNRLGAERRVRDPKTNKFKWDAGSRRNEQLDCRVYAFAMVYAYRQCVEEWERDRLKDRDYILSWDAFWDYLDPPDT